MLNKSNKLRGKSQGQANSWKNIQILFSICFLGCLTSFVLFFALHNMNSEQASKEFEMQFQKSFKEIQHIVKKDTNILHILGGVFEADPNTSYQKFDSIASRIMEQNKRVKALEWIPKVSKSQLNYYLKVAKKSGFQNFKIYEKQNGKRIILKERPFYFPVLYVSPVKGNEAAIGYDLGSNPVRKAALDKAALSHDLIATEPVKLIQGIDKRASILLFKSVHDHHGGHDELVGYVLMILEVEKLFSEHFEGSKSYLDLTIQDITLAKQVMNIYQSPYHSETKNNLLTTFEDFEFADRVWRVTGSEIEDHYFLNENSFAVLILIFSLGLTFIVTGYFHATLKSQQRIDSEVRRKSKALKINETQLQAIFDSSHEGIILIDSSWRIMNFNNTIIQILGYTEDELLEQNIRNIINISIDQFEDTREKEHLVTNISTTNKNKSQLNLELSIRRLTIHNEIYYILMIKNETKEKTFSLALERLEKLNYKDLSLSETLDEILRIGLNAFELKHGIISKIEDKDYNVENVISPNSDLEPGLQFLFENTYCSITYEIDDVVAIHHCLEDMRINSHPCYKFFQLESYIAYTIYINGKKYGTINFSSEDKRSSFSELEKELIKILAHKIEYILEVERHKKSLEDSLAFYRAILDNSPDIIFVKDSNLNIIEANQAFWNMYDEPPEELIGTTTFEKFPPEQAEEFKKQDLIVFEKGESSEVLEPVTNTAGETKLFNTRKIPFDSEFHGQVLLAVGTDVTEIIKDKKEKQINGERFAKALNSAAHAVAITDSHYNYTNINQSFIDYFGYSEEELLGGMNFKDLTHPDYMPESKNVVKPLLEGKTDYIQIEKKYVHKSGKTLWGLTSVAVLRDEYDEISGFMSQTIDITKLKKYQEQLENTVKTLEKPSV